MQNYDFKLKKFFISYTFILKIVHLQTKTIKVVTKPTIKLIILSFKYNKKNNNF